MGLLETIWEHIAARFSLKALPLVVPAFFASFIIYKAARIAWENIKISKMRGTRAAQIPNVGIFGLRFVRKAIRATQHHKNLEMWRDIFSEAGSYTAESRTVGRRVLFTADPENIKAILATQFSDYGKGEPFHQEWFDFLGDSIFVTDGESWHASRQLIRPQFVKDRVSDLHCFESHMDTLFRAIANGGALEGPDQPVDMTPGKHDGQTLDISDLFFRYTLDVATDFLLGMDVQSLSTPREAFADAFAEVQRVQNLITRAGPLNPLVPRKTFWAGMKIIDAMINRYIERTLRLPPEELATGNDDDKSKSRPGMDYTFLHALAGFTRDRKVLHDQLIAVLLAGRDTTASSLSWTLYELARHPTVVARLRAEILQVVGPDRTPTYDDLKSMKYLQNVMNETLRLYPVVPFNVRLALRDTTLPRGGGPDGMSPVAVLKDTPIGYSTMVMQRRADLYPPVSDNFPPVEAFAPERWMQGWQPKPWQYIPFNGGPRICIGQQFALTEMGYVLTRMFQRFERVETHMGPVDGGKPTLKAEIVLQPGDGVIVAFYEAKREKA